MSRLEADRPPLESRLLKPKLVQAVATDFPLASQVLLEFPEEWVLTARLQGDTPLYIGGWTQAERVRGDHFRHLPPKVNESLDRYSLYKFFQPWPMPSLLVAWDETAAIGRVIKTQDVKIQMQPIGQAQIWRGNAYAVLWECYLFAPDRGRPGWESCLTQVWQELERDVGARVVYTLPHEPAWPEGDASYREFLRRLGYAPSQEHHIWWSKAVVPV